MSQYSFTSPTPGDPSNYREWLIDAPTSRRIDCAVMDASIARGMSCEGRRLSLGADSDGDNWIMIVTSDRAELHAIMASPAMKRRGQQWRANSPRYGSWRYYLEDVALARAVFEFAGWTMTPEESALMDALDEYGRQAPARYAVVKAS
jgi:hypothetical protein